MSDDIIRVIPPEDKPNPPRYRVQYGNRERFAEFSEWFEAGTPLPDCNILGIHMEKVMTWDEWNEYARKYLPQRNIK